MPIDLFLSFAKVLTVVTEKIVRGIQNDKFNY
jgi:hypothetical protein